MPYITLRCFAHTETMYFVVTGLMAANEQCPVEAVKGQQEECYDDTFPPGAYFDSTDDICR